MEYCFVILHYLTLQDTIECVDSIRNKMCNKDYSIVIVDNFSNNGSLEKLQLLYENNSIIHIVTSEINLGFAQGNNLGYRYARNKLKARNIIVLNNDIILNTDNVFDIIEYEVSNYNTYIIGPDIVSLVDDGHQNPLYGNVLTKSKAIALIIKYRIICILIKMHLYNLVLPKKKKFQINISDKECNRIENCKLHGAFLIFTHKFVENEQNAFHPGTFLYLEEEILYRYCIAKNYKMVYNPDVSVFHKEDSSTNSLLSVPMKKKLFVLENNIKSLKVYLSILRENKNA